jgi:hypothetical protein
VSDHWHYANEIPGAAEQHHRHYDLENLVDGLREDLNRALERIHELETAGGGPRPYEPEEYDPRPEAGDEGRMSEYRHAGFRPMCTDDIDPGTGQAWGVDPTESGEQS